MVDPISSPVTRSAIFLPTITSYNPGVKLRPWTTLIPLRTLKAIGDTPRNVTLAGCPSVRLGRVVRMTTSHDASGPPALSRATRGSTMTTLASSIRIHDVNSDIDPRCVTMPFNGDPVDRSEMRKPASIDNRATNTASSVTFQRCPKLRTLYITGSAIRFASTYPRCGRGIPSPPERTRQPVPAEGRYPAPTPRSAPTVQSWDRLPRCLPPLAHSAGYRAALC